MPKMKWTIEGENDHPHADHAEMERVAEHAKSYITGAAPALMQQMEDAANRDHVSQSAGQPATPFTLAANVTVKTHIVP